MKLAEDMGRLRHEIEEIRSARIALKKRLGRFASDLRQNMNQTRASFRREQADRARAVRNALDSFVRMLRHTSRETLNSYRSERAAARDAWFPGRHGRRPVRQSPIIGSTETGSQNP